jgi:putative acetyltransferase
MSAQANPKLALRPMLPADVPLLAEIFRESVLELTGDDYSVEQQEAWAANADNIKEFGERLAKQLTLVATLDGSPVGFASLKGKDEIEMLFVHPAASRYGAATMLVDALEKLAASRGTESLKVDASDTAREFFEKRGYVAHQRNSVSLGRVWFANTTMKKALAQKGDAREKA